MAARIRIESISTAPIHPCAQVPPFSQVEARRVRSNLDFQPLVDDMAALEYVTKYGPCRPGDRPDIIAPF